jgi:hypothetical protein
VRLTPRLTLRIFLLLVAIVVFALRLMPRGSRGFGAHAPASRNDLSVTSPLNQPGGGPAPAEAYTIYSSLYQAPSPTPIDEPLVFAKNSQTDIPQIAGGSCLRPANEEERKLSAGFDAANAQSREWQQQFNIPAGYRLLSPAEINQAEDCFARRDLKSPQCAAWAQVRHIRYLGVPALDASGTHALVSVMKTCGNQCGGGGIFEVEKDGASWKRMPETDFTRDCSWVY